MDEKIPTPNPSPLRKEGNQWAIGMIVYVDGKDKATIKQIDHSTAMVEYAFGTAPDTVPLEDLRMEQSPLSPPATQGEVETPEEVIARLEADKSRLSQQVDLLLRTNALRQNMIDQWENATDYLAAKYQELEKEEDSALGELEERTEQLRAVELELDELRTAHELLSRSGSIFREFELTEEDESNFNSYINSGWLVAHEQVIIHQRPDFTKFPLRVVRFEREFVVGDDPQPEKEAVAIPPLTPPATQGEDMDAPKADDTQPIVIERVHSAAKPANNPQLQSPLSPPATQGEAVIAPMMDVDRQKRRLVQRVDVLPSIIVGEDCFEGAGEFEPELGGLTNAVSPETALFVARNFAAARRETVAALAAGITIDDLMTLPFKKALDQIEVNS